MIIKRGTKFKKDFKKIRNDRGIVEEFQKIIKKLVEEKKLEEKYNDHALQWKYKGLRECHIRPDVSLIYEIDKWDFILYLFRLWSHSELF